MPELDRSEFIGVSCSFELFVEKFSSGPPDISIVGGSLNYSFPVLTTKCHHWGSPQVDKFEQVSSHAHQMSLVGVGPGFGRYLYSGVSWLLYRKGSDSVQWSGEV